MVPPVKLAATYDPAVLTFRAEVDACDTQALTSADCAEHMQVISTQVIDAWYREWAGSSAEDKPAVRADINRRFRQILPRALALWTDFQRDGWRLPGTSAPAPTTNRMLSLAALHTGTRPAARKALDLDRLGWLLDPGNMTTLYAHSTDSKDRERIARLVSQRHSADRRIFDLARPLVDHPSDPAKTIEAFGAMSATERDAVLKVLPQGLRRTIGTSLIGSGRLDDLEQRLGGNAQRRSLFHQLGGGRIDDGEAPGQRMRMALQPVVISVRADRAPANDPAPNATAAGRSPPASGTTLDTARRFLRDGSQGDAHVRHVAASLIAVSEAVRFLPYRDPATGVDIALGYSLTAHEATRVADLQAAGVPADQVDDVIAGHRAMTLAQVETLTMHMIEHGYEPMAKRLVGEDTWSRIGVEHKAVLIDLVWSTKNPKRFKNAIASLRTNPSQRPEPPPTWFTRAWRGVAALFGRADVQRRFGDEIVTRFQDADTGEWKVDQRRYRLRQVMLSGERAWGAYLDRAAEVQARRSSRRDPSHTKGADAR